MANDRKLRPAMPGRFTAWVSAEVVVAAIFGLFGLSYALYALTTVDGQASVLPAASGFIAFLLAGLNIVSSVHHRPTGAGADAEPDEVTVADAEDEARELPGGDSALYASDSEVATAGDQSDPVPGNVAWVLVAFGLIVTLGFLWGIPLFMLLYLRLRAKESYLYSIAYTLIFMAIMYGMFEWLIGLRGYAGIFELSPERLL